MHAQIMLNKLSSMSVSHVRRSLRMYMAESRPIVSISDGFVRSRKYLPTNPNCICKGLSLSQNFKSCQFLCRYVRRQFRLSLPTPQQSCSCLDYENKTWRLQQAELNSPHFSAKTVCGPSTYCRTASMVAGSILCPVLPSPNPSHKLLPICG